MTYIQHTHSPQPLQHDAGALLVALDDTHDGLTHPQAEQQLEVAVVVVAQVAQCAQGLCEVGR